jgi:hypothetical protein
MPYLWMWITNGNPLAFHPQVAHDMTAKVFGPTSALTGHRALRLGVARFAQGKLSEAAGLLQSAQEALLVGGVTFDCERTSVRRLGQLSLLLRHGEQAWHASVQ